MQIYGSEAALCYNLDHSPQTLRQLISLMAVSLGQLEESPGSSFLLLFHIICLAITSSLPWTWGIITIFQYKDSRGERERGASLAWRLFSAPCCEEGTDRTSYRSSPDTNDCSTLARDLGQNCTACRRTHSKWA